MDSLLQVACLALGGLTYVAYWHPEGYMRLVRPLLPYVYAVGFVGFTIWTKASGFDLVQTALAGAVVGGGIGYLIFLGEMDRIGIGRRHRK